MTRPGLFVALLATATGCTHTPWGASDPYPTNTGAVHVVMTRDYQYDSLGEKASWEQRDLYFAPDGGPGGGTDVYRCTDWPGPGDCADATGEWAGDHRWLLADGGELYFDHHVFHRYDAQHAELWSNGVDHLATITPPLGPVVNGVLFMVGSDGTDLWLGELDVATGGTRFAVDLDREVD